MGEPTSFRCREVAFAPADMAEFAALLAAEYPQARYLMEASRAERRRKAPPRLLLSSCLMRVYRAASRYSRDIDMILAPHWRPHWYRSASSGLWTFWWPHHPNVHFRWFGLPKPAQRDMPPRLRLSGIEVAINPYFKEQETFRRRFYRLFGKVASDRNLADMTYPGGEIVQTYVDRTSQVWVGHHARAWALADPRRFLRYYERQPHGLRPLPPAT